MNKLKKMYSPNPFSQVAASSCGYIPLILQNSLILILVDCRFMAKFRCDLNGLPGKNEEKCYYQLFKTYEWNGDKQRGNGRKN